MTLVSGNITFMRIFAGFPGEGMSRDSEVVENGNFHYFLISSGALEVRPTLLYAVNQGNIVLPGNFEWKHE